MKIKVRFYQLLHKSDNGELTLCSDGKDTVNIICKKCKTFWKLPTPFRIGVSKDFIEFKRQEALCQK